MLHRSSERIANHPGFDQEVLECHLAECLLARRIISRIGPVKVVRWLSVAVDLRLDLINSLARERSRDCESVLALDTSGSGTGGGGQELLIIIGVPDAGDELIHVHGAEGLAWFTDSVLNLIYSEGVEG